MQPDSRKHLTDMQTAIKKIREYTRGKEFADYKSESMLRDAVERRFEIIGIALGEFANLDPVLADRISDYPKIIAFRNILAHGYGYIDHATVWDVVVTHLPLLARQVDALLEEA